MTHGLIYPPASPVENEFALPEPKGTVLLERRHPADDAVVHEGRHAPFEGLLDIRVRLVYQLAQVLKDRPCEPRRHLYIGNHSRIFLDHDRSPQTATLYILI